MVKVELESRICPHEYPCRYIVTRTNNGHHIPFYCHKFMDEINPLEVFEEVCLSQFGFKYGFCSDSKDGAGWEINYGRYREEDHVRPEHARRTQFLDIADENSFRDELAYAVKSAEQKLLQKAGSVKVS
jgi:hypothetical protein